MKTNYHTHHKFCPHAEGTTEDYVKEAITHGFQVLGMSDHAPNKQMNDDYVRMDDSLFQKYINDIETTKKRYKDQITVLKGVEVEFFPDHNQYYKRLMKQVDYMILGQHYFSLDGSMKRLKSTIDLTTPTDLSNYASTIEEALKTQYFDILAHPDIYMFAYLEFDEHAKKTAERVIKASIKYNVPLEYNANGLRRGNKKVSKKYHPRYPRAEFWEIAEYLGATVILGSDCHKPSFLYDDIIKQAEQKLHSYNLNIIERITLKRP